MQWLQSAFGSDGSPIVQYVSIFAVIFVVLTVIVLVVRRLGGGGLADAKRAGQRGRQPRLGIVDVYELDRQRQLILLRRDNVEHLLLVGGPNDVVIERHIQRGQQRDPALRPEPMAEPLPDGFPNTLPDTLPDGANAGLPAIDGRRPEAAFPPNFAMPVVLPPAVPGSSAAPPVAHPLDAGALDSAEPGTDRASEAIVTGPRPEVPGRRPMRRTTPPLINPRPDVASERPRPEPAPPENQDGAASMPSMAPAERRPIDPAILSDMARQLEAALARPASAVTPPPARPAPPTEIPAPAPVKPAAVDPMAAAMAAPVAIPAARDERPDESLFEAPAAPPAPAPAPPSPEPFLPAPPPSEPPMRADPPPSPAPTVSAPVEPPEPPPKPPAEPSAPVPKVETPRDLPPPSGPKPAANPFSVEEIEAEFARLLGRPLDKRN